MTYNFDPERWYDIELKSLERRRAGGGLSGEDFDAALAALQDRYEAMLDRLAGRFDFSDPPTPNTGDPDQP